MGTVTGPPSTPPTYNHVVTRVGSSLYDWTSSTSMTLISNSASAGNWKLSGDRITNLDGNGLWVKDGSGGWVKWSAPGVQEYQVYR